MTTVTGGAVILIVVGSVLLIAGLVISWRRASVRQAAAPGRRQGAVQEESTASPASEAIEDLVNERLAGIPGLSETRVDFATAPDGSLEIRVGEERYTAVDQIRDPRIRQAVEDAVAAFNK